MNIISQNTAFGGMQGVFSHDSEACKCEMTFAVFVPPQAIREPRPVLWYLSGLTCTHANVMEKGEYRRMAAELGLIIVSISSGTFPGERLAGTHSRPLFRPLSNRERRHLR